MTNSGSPETSVLRPSRRPLLFMGPLVAAETALVGLLIFDRNLAFERTVLQLLALVLPVTLLMLLAIWQPWRYVLIMMGGRTEVGPDELVNRTIVGRTTLRWPDIAFLDVRRSLFGRRLWAVLKKRRRRVALVAPRDGLLVSTDEFDAALAQLKQAASAHAVPVNERKRLSPRLGWTVFGLAAVLVVTSLGLLTRPWLDGWWPGRLEVADPPRACAIDGIDGLVPGLYQIEDRYNAAAQESSCGWGLEPDSKPGDSVLEISIIWFRRGFSHDSGWQAHDDLMRRQESNQYKAVPGLGDEAAEHFYPPDSSGVWGDVIARKANVVIVVSYGAKQPDDDVIPTAERIAGTVVSQLDAS